MATVFELASATLAEVRALRNRANEVERVLSARRLTLPQLEVLTVANAEMPLGDIADRMQCSRGNLTGVADRLEAKGLIERVRSKEDRRIVKVRRTPAGDALLGELQTVTL